VAKKMKAKDLAILCADISRLRRKFHLNDIKAADVVVEYLKDAKTHTLADVRVGLSANGTPTVKTIHVIHDGREEYFDGRYEFEVVALRVKEQLIEY
jgi:hypothetical protein